MPTRAATGPDARAPTKLPAIAAAVHSGKRRFAWRASKVEVATVQPIVTAVAPAANTVSQAIGIASAGRAAMAVRSMTSSDSPRPGGSR